MDTSAEARPIIIKKKKVKKSDGHHGGAWKVAYADFVTAMMAFFLLMWLLNATTEDQRKGLADYFSPTIPISRISGGGADGLNGSSVFTEETYAQMGTGASRSSSMGAPAEQGESSEAQDASGETIAENLEALKAELLQGPQHLSEHLMVKLSPEGIVLELVESDSSPLFSVGRSNPTPLMNELLGLVSQSFDKFGNNIKIVGHTDSSRYRSQGGYDNWNLSSDRANSARKMLIEAGVAPHRIQEVSGRADTDPLVPEDPHAAQNRRISVVILTE